MRFGSLFLSNAVAYVADDRKGEIVRVLCVHVRDFSLFDLVISFNYHAGINYMLRPTPFYHPLNFLTVPFR